MSVYKYKKTIDLQSSVRKYEILLDNPNTPAKMKRNAIIQLRLLREELASRTK